MHPFTCPKSGRAQRAAVNAWRMPRRFQQGGSRGLGGSRCVFCEALRGVAVAGIFARRSRQVEEEGPRLCTWARALEGSASRSTLTTRSWPTLGSVMGVVATDRRHSWPASSRGQALPLCCSGSPSRRRGACGGRSRSATVFSALAHAMTGFGVRCSMSLGQPKRPPQDACSLAGGGGSVDHKLSCRLRLCSPLYWPTRLCRGKWALCVAELIGPCVF